MADSKTWAERVTAWHASGLSANAFAKDKGYSGSALYYWLRRLEDHPVPVKASASSMLARVVRTPTATSTVVSSTRTDCTRTDGVVIEFAGARIVVRAGFDRAVLTAALDVLDDRARGARQ